MLLNINPQLPEKGRELGTICSRLKATSAKIKVSSGENSLHPVFFFVFFLNFALVSNGESSQLLLSDTLAAISSPYHALNMDEGAIEPDC